MKSGYCLNGHYVYAIEYADCGPCDYVHKHQQNPQDYPDPTCKEKCCNAT